MILKIKYNDILSNRYTNQDFVERLKVHSENKQPKKMSLMQSELLLTYTFLLILCYIALFSQVKEFTKLKVFIQAGQLLQTVDNSFITNKSKSRRIN